MYAPASDARNTTTRRSPPLPSRPSGTLRRSSASRCSSVIASGHVRLDETRGDRVHGDAARPDFLGERARDADRWRPSKRRSCSARRCPCARPRKRRSRCAPGAPSSSAQHAGRGGRDHRRWCRGRRPLVGLHAHEQIVTGDAGVVDQHLGCARALRDGLESASTEASSVTSSTKPPSARMPRPFADGLGAASPRRRAGYAIARGGQRVRDRRADAAARARDEGDGTAGVPFIAHLPRTSGRRARSSRARRRSADGLAVSSRSMRLIMPVSTLPGPDSSARVTPAAERVPRRSPSSARGHVELVEQLARGWPPSSSGTLRIDVLDHRERPAQQRRCRRAPRPAVPSLASSARSGSAR